tara:strand:- start:4884 stop:5975 length:1092 start_codon:yes stop_codon:yes gene_type:complete
MSRYNDVLMHVTFILLSVGIIMVYSSSIKPHASYLSGLPNLTKQFLSLFIGLFMFVVSSHVNHRKLIDLSKGLLVFSIIIVLIGYIANSGQNTNRWLSVFGLISFQTSELLKICLIIFTASFIDSYKRKLKDIRFMFFNYYIYILPCIGLVLFQPDLSSATIILLICMSMLFIAGINWKQIRYFSMLAAFGFLGKVFIYPMLTGVKNYQFFRWTGWLSGEVYQQNNAINSIAYGGFWGMGLGKSIWKTEHVPEANTDFIFSVITSEFGFLGIMFLFGAFICLFIRGIEIVKECQDLFGMFLCLGIVINLMIYFIVHVGYNIGLLPTTGLPLPFMSYGGSHTMFNLIQIGLLLSISYKNKKKNG